METRENAQQLTPRASSETSPNSSIDEARTSLSDEAQACYNLLLILRNDTQHLISLRNENLSLLEGRDKSALPSLWSITDEKDCNDDITIRTAHQQALLALVNESIIAAMRSVTEMGPFLERYRWPTAISAGGPEQQQRRSFIKLKAPAKLLKRRRTRSVSGPTSKIVSSAEDRCHESGLSSQELFAWTLGLTAQHTAVLVATSRLEEFLHCGTSVVCVDEVKRREGRESWWKQDRGEFENVELIQSLLAARPRRKLQVKAPTPDLTAGSDLRAKEREANTQPETSGNHDSQSNTLISEPFSEPTTSSSPEGLTAPKHQHPDPLHAEEQFSVRQAITRLRASSPQTNMIPGHGNLSRTETFGHGHLTDTSLCNQPHAKQWCVAPLHPPLVVISDGSELETVCKTDKLQAQIPEEDGAKAESTARTALSSEVVAHVPPLTLSSLIASNDRALQRKSIPRDSDFPSSPLSRPVSSVMEASYKPFDPHTSMDQRMVTLFMRGALPTKTIQSVVQQLDNMAVSPVEAQESQIANLPAAVSPAASLQSQNSVLSTTSANDETTDSHWPYLAYMARKQAVVSSRWALQRVENK